MPTVLIIRGYRFFFYMNEHKPIHIHVAKAGCEARFDLVPEIDMTHCHGFRKNEIRDIVNIIDDRYDDFVKSWRETFGE